MEAPLLTTAATSDPKVKNSLDQLEKLPAFSPKFNTLKEALKEYILANHENAPRGWAPDWNLEVAIMTWLFGEGHA